MRKRLLAPAVSIAIAVVGGCSNSVRPTISGGETSDGESSGRGVRGSAASTDTRDLSEADVADRIARLNDVVIPSVGTTRENVDDVYGEPRVAAFEEYGDPPAHIYQLLPPEGRAEFRAYLHVKYRGGKVYRAAINHYCVVKNSAPRLTQEEKDQFVAEQRRVLVDLETVREKYRAKLLNAEWGRSQH